MDKNSRNFGCETVQFGVCLPKFQKMMVVLNLRCTLTICQNSALCCYFTIFNVLHLMWQFVRSSYCRQLNAFSFNTALHAPLYRSIHNLVTRVFLGTMQVY
jgi:hypothetical protein